MVPDDKPEVKDRVSTVCEPVARLIGVDGDDDPPLTEASGFPLTKISVIVASDDPVFLRLNTTVLESEAYAFVTSSFSNRVNAPVNPAAQNATAIAIATATAIRITVAMTGLIPFLFLVYMSGVFECQHINLFFSFLSERHLFVIY